jgi:hypothetical protein
MGVSLLRHTAQNSLGISLGQAGSIYCGSGDAITVNGGVFVAIQIIEDAVFESTNGLVSEDDTMFPNTQSSSTHIHADGEAVDSVTFPAGITIYGRWTGFELASGKVIAYLGP